MLGLLLFKLLQKLPVLVTIVAANDQLIKQLINRVVELLNLRAVMLD